MLNWLRLSATRLTAVLLTVYSGISLASAQNAENQLEALKRPGHHAILRHAIAPGTGDPAGMSLQNCATQRNLNEAGREQARDLGQLFKDAGIKPTRILTSAWCRAKDTAELMDLGPVEVFEPVSSIWTEPDSVKRSRTSNLVSYLEALDPDETVLMVTHWINISELTGRGPTSGGGFVITVDEGEVDIVSEISPP